MTRSPDSFGSLNPCKQQGARLDLSSLVWFSWIPSNVIDFHEISWISFIWSPLAWLSWIWLNFIDFPRILWISLIWEVSGENAVKAKKPCAALTRKIVGSPNPSKEQGARLDLSSLAWFSWIPSNFNDFYRISSISWIWEVSGDSAIQASGTVCCP